MKCHSQQTTFAIGVNMRNRQKRRRLEYARFQVEDAYRGIGVFACEGEAVFDDEQPVAIAGRAEDLYRRYQIAGYELLSGDSGAGRINGREEE